jgi:hypothetical protein
MTAVADAVAQHLTNQKALNALLPDGMKVKEPIDDEALARASLNAISISKPHDAVKLIQAQGKLEESSTKLEAANKLTTAAGLKASDVNDTSPGVVKPNPYQFNGKSFSLGDDHGAEQMAQIRKGQEPDTNRPEMNNDLGKVEQQANTAFSQQQQMLMMQQVIQQRAEVMTARRSIQTAIHEQMKEAAQSLKA